jgi:hypothetical protein
VKRSDSDDGRGDARSLLAAAELHVAAPPIVIQPQDATTMHSVLYRRAHVIRARLTAPRRRSQPA